MSSAEEAGAPRVTWEPEVAKIIAGQLATDPGKYATRPLMVAVVGIPGAGKTTGTGILHSLVPRSVVIPVDGFHHYRAQLKARPDADAAVYRRGEIRLSRQHLWTHTFPAGLRLGRSKCSTLFVCWVLGGLDKARIFTEVIPTPILVGNQ